MPISAPPLPNAASALDGPPPSPQGLGGGPTGQPTPFSLGALAGPQVSSAQLPPEMLTGILQSSETIGQLLDSYAQATPDLAADWSAVKDLLATTLAKLVAAGGGPTAPTATGPAFPAAFDRGMPNAGPQ